MFQRRNFFYYDREGVVGNINVIKAYVDYIGVWFGGRVENVIGIIFVFNDISFSFSVIWGQNCVGYFFFFSSFGINYKVYFFIGFYSGGDFRIWRKVQEERMEVLFMDSCFGFLRINYLYLCCLYL